MPSEIEAKVNQHGHEIAYIKDALGQALEGIGSLNKNMSELCLKLSIYIERHEQTQESIKRLNDRCERLDSQQNKQALVVATHTPVIESIRGMANKLIWAFLGGLCLIATSGYFALSSGAPAA